jgi:GNAT superfamily N-acetyltransferase
MKKFISHSKNALSERCDTNSAMMSELQYSTSQQSHRETIDHCLRSYACLSPTSNSNVRRLRLAKCDDAETIRRLVQGLADCQKESEAVYVTADHYRMDGYHSEKPFFYCVIFEVLVDSQADTDNRIRDEMKTDDPTSNLQNWYAFGMAFCWIGCKVSKDTTTNHHDCAVKEEMFIFLEDLFIEEMYRGDGAGTFMMMALAEISLSLNCPLMVWQAVDWNTPALTFYQNKIGAQIVNGLLSTQFAGSTLLAFHTSTKKHIN